MSEWAEGLLGGTVTVEVTRARGAIGVDGLRLSEYVGLVSCRVNIDESMNKVRWKMEDAPAMLARTCRIPWKVPPAVP